MREDWKTDNAEFHIFELMGPHVVRHKIKIVVRKQVRVRSRLVRGVRRGCQAIIILGCA